MHPSASTMISTGILGLSSLTLIGSVLLPRPPACHDQARRGRRGRARRAAGDGAPSKAGVVFQNAALARSPAEHVLGLSQRLASRAGVPLTDPLQSNILQCAPGPRGIGCISVN